MKFKIILHETVPQKIKTNTQTKMYSLPVTFKVEMDSIPVFKNAILSNLYNATQLLTLCIACIITKDLSK